MSRENFLNILKNLKMIQKGFSKIHIRDKIERQWKKSAEKM